MEGFGKRKDGDEKRPENEEPTDKKNLLSRKNEVERDRIKIDVSADLRNHVPQANSMKTNSQKKFQSQFPLPIIDNKPFERFSNPTCLCNQHNQFLVEVCYFICTAKSDFFLNLVSKLNIVIIM